MGPDDVFANSFLLQLVSWVSKVALGAGYPLSVSIFLLQIDVP